MAAALVLRRGLPRITLVAVGQGELIPEGAVLFA